MTIEKDWRNTELGDVLSAWGKRLGMLGDAWRRKAGRANQLSHKGREFCMGLKERVDGEVGIGRKGCIAQFLKSSIQKLKTGAGWLVLLVLELPDLPDTNYRT